MGRRGRKLGWRVAAGIALACACAPVGLHAQTAPDKQQQVQPKAPAPGPFGLSPEAMAQARRFAARVRAATQAAAKQVAEQFPKTQATAPPGQPTPPPTQPTPAQPAPVAPPPAKAQPPVPPPVQGKPPPPGGVDWGLALADQRRSADVGPRAVEGLSLNPAAVNRTAVPILLLRGAFIDGARIYSFGDYYSITADMQGARISLTGTTALVKLPASTRLSTPAAAGQLVVQRTVDGQLASFVRYGVLYTVELRCDAPDDARCRTDAVVLDLVARDTIVVFGKAARQAAAAGG
jgi:hypothetical protein